MTRNRFNSRPRMGGDELYRDHGSEDKVSTHAPAWGATSFGAHVSGSIDGFNSRPRMGGDGVVVGLSIKLWFQLTPPHGGRPEQVERIFLDEVSTHAPAWGATVSFSNAVIAIV